MHVLARNDDSDRSLSRGSRNLGDTVPLPVAARQETPGALTASYDVPSAEFRPSPLLLTLPVSAAMFAVLIGRHEAYIWEHTAYRPLFCVLLASTLFITIQWMLALLDRPARVKTARQQRQLDALHVVVNVPVYNEAPAFLDRCLWALANQSRPPDVIHVIDDGSVEDYTALQAHWEGEHGSTRVVWQRQRNAGKKVAQSVTFMSFPDADIFVTVDSDSALEHHAIEYGLVPFTDPQVQSVAGMELVYNQSVNWITRIASSRTRLFQVVICSAQSVLGDMLVNRGPLAFYRADMIREIVPAYINETFFGQKVKLGDDAALTLFARGKGKAVQQANCFTFAMHPETLSHHFRQWIRWMRGSTIRNCWRIRYLSPLSYSWWFTIVNLFFFLLSCAVPLVVAVTWPRSEGIGLWLLAVLVPWAYITGIRVLSVHRSDESVAGRLLALVFYPTAVIWGLLVLRWLRFWGIVTYWKQGWNTRQEGAEDLSLEDMNHERFICT